MKVTFWARLPFAEARVTEHLRRVSGASVTVVRTLPEVLQALPGTRFMVLPDAPADQATEIVRCLTLPDNTVGWMHFNSAGREGFIAAGIPPEIGVSQAAGALAPTVAEHVFALALALNRRIPEVLAAQAQAMWQPGLGGLRCLDNGTALIVGLGHIGREVAKRARAFGMRVVGTSRTKRAEPLVDEMHGLAAVPRLLGEADLIVLCIALSAETRHILSRRELERAKPNAVLVNVGRGGLVDSGALVDALGAGRLAGAGLDVTDPEPLPPGHPLWRAPNVLISSHVAGVGERGETRIAESAARSLTRFIEAQSATRGGSSPIDRR